MSGFQQERPAQESISDTQMSNDSEQFLRALNLLGSGAQFSLLDGSENQEYGKYLPSSSLGLFRSYETPPSNYKNLNVTSNDSLLTQAALYMKDPSKVYAYAVKENVENIADCANLCTTDKECFSFGYYPNTKQCFLRKPDRESYVKLATVNDTDLGWRMLDGMKKPPSEEQPFVNPEVYEIPSVTMDDTYQPPPQL